MRRVLSLLVLGLIAGPLSADQVVLRDGRTLDTKKPPVIRGKQAVLTLADGKLVSIPASEIDTAKTAALAKKAAEAPKVVATPVPGGPQTIAEAAKAGQTAKKATVVLTDQDVAGGETDTSGDAEAKGEGDVLVGPVTTSKVPTGYLVEGTIQNAGKGQVLGARVTIEAIGEDGKSIATTFGQVAKDTLEPGETAAFRAQIDTDKTVARFTYVPRWQAPLRPKAAVAGGGEGTPPAEGEGETPEPAPTPAPAPEPTPEPPPARNPDYAAPPANAPVGAPAQPGGTYLPPPSSDQPKPPGGGA